MQAVFKAWKEKYKANIVDMGGGLKPGGKVLTASGVTDGPFTEAKEIVGGYMLVSAESYERALEHALRCALELFVARSEEVTQRGGGCRRRLWKYCHISPLASRCSG